MFKKNQKIKWLFFLAVVILLVFLFNVNKSGFIGNNLVKFLNPIQSNSYSFASRLHTAFVVLLKPDYFKDNIEQTKIIQGTIQDEKNKVLLQENKKLKETITSPHLKGNNIEEAWKGLLREPEKYRVIGPTDFLQPVKRCLDTKAFFEYLEKRYWD